MLFIPEGDLYRLIVHSKLPSAERFERWVFDEMCIRDSPYNERKGMTMCTVKEIQEEIREDCKIGRASCRERV